MSEIAKLQGLTPNEIASVAGISSDSITSVNGILWPASVASWKKVADGNVTELVVYNSKLYAAANSDGILWEWNGADAFVNKAPAYYPGGHASISNFKVYRGEDYTENPGILLCMAYGVSPWGGDCLSWGGGSVFTMFVPQLGTSYEGFYQPSVVPGGLCQFWNESTYSLHAVSYQGRTYMAFYLGPGAIWGMNANRLNDFLSCAVETSYHKIYIGTKPRYGVYGGKCYRFAGTGYFVEATKWGSENNISLIIEYSGNIFAITGNGYLLLLDPSHAEWDCVANPEGDTIVRWCVHGGYIYAVTNNLRLLYSSGGGWTDTLTTPPLGESLFKSLISFNGKLYAGGSYGLYEK